MAETGSSEEVVPEAKEDGRKPWWFKKGQVPNPTGRNQYSKKKEEEKQAEESEVDGGLERLKGLMADVWPAEVPEGIRWAPPRGMDANRRYRARLLAWVGRNKERREQVLKRCREDILWYVNTFVWQFNPNAIGEGSREMGPFVTWEVQDQALRMIMDCIPLRKDMVVEKSREMGATWLFLIAGDWLCLFGERKKVLMISKSAS